MGALGDFYLLHYFRNCEIKISGLIHIFGASQEILTRPLLLQEYMQLDPGGLDYHRVLAWWTQISIYFSPLWMYMV